MTYKYTKGADPKDCGGCDRCGRELAKVDLQLEMYNKDVRGYVCKDRLGCTETRRRDHRRFTLFGFIEESYDRYGDRQRHSDTIYLENLTYNDLIAELANLEEFDSPNGSREAWVVKVFETYEWAEWDDEWLEESERPDRERAIMNVGKEAGAQHKKARLEREAAKKAEQQRQELEAQKRSARRQYEELKAKAEKGEI